MSYPSYGQPQNVGPQGYGSAGYGPQGHGAPQSPSLGFMQALRLAWARKFEIEGRSRRSEYWWLRLGSGIVGFVVYIVAAIIFAIGSAMGHGVGVVAAIIAGLIFLALLIALIPVEFTELVRRLHDTDRSGWWMLISLVPFVGGIILLVFTVMDSTPGPNRFGASPKEALGAAGTPGGYSQGWPGQTS